MYGYRTNIHRRTWRSQTTKRMETFGVHIAVLFNIENKHYTKGVPLGIDFMKEFSSIIHSDKNRKTVPTTFAEILETNEGLSVETVKVFVKSKNI